MNIVDTIVNGSANLNRMQAEIKLVLGTLLGILVTIKVKCLPDINHFSLDVESGGWSMYFDGAVYGVYFAPRRKTAIKWYHKGNTVLASSDVILVYAVLEPFMKRITDQFPAIMESPQWKAIAAAAEVGQA